FHDVAPHLAASLRAFARHEGVTLYAVLLAGFGVLLSRLSGCEDLTIGIPFASQAAQGAGALLCHGVNTLPLRLRIDPPESFAASAHRSHHALPDAAENQDVTLYTLLGARDRRRAERGPSVDVIFNLNPRMPPLDFGELRYALRDCPKAALVRDLFCNLN